MSKNNRDFFSLKNSWSIIKDNLLACYLKPYFAKLLQTGKPIFYVDCFAGKGIFDDGQFGSPLIAMKVREECCEISRISCDPFSRIEVCFIEKNLYDDLRHNVSSIATKYCQPIVLNGSFEDVLYGQLVGKHGFNVFLYIDPYGIKFLNFDLFNKLNLYEFNSIELLLNFNSFGFFRAACSCLNVEYIRDEALTDIDDLIEYEPFTVNADEKSADLLTKIAGGDYWKDIVLKYRNGEINGYEAEKELAYRFSHKLRECFKYVLDMPIRTKQANRPKYRMIHACNHYEGCWLMAENILKRNDELYYDVQQGGQLELFENDDVNKTSIDKSLSDDEFEMIIEKAIDKIHFPKRWKHFVADFYNENGIVCTINRIKEYLKSNGRIEIIREPEYTDNSRKKSTFWSDTNSKKVYIRRK